VKVIHVSTRTRSEMVPITAQIQDAVREAGIEDGLVMAFVPHTTAGITINEQADPDVAADIIHTLDRLVPWNGPYAHEEGNAAAHVKATLVGASVMVPVEHGRLRLGTWQGIFLCEFDGPRSRQVWVSVVGPSRAK